MQLKVAFRINSQPDKNRIMSEKQNKKKVESHKCTALCKLLCFMTITSVYYSVSTNINRCGLNELMT